jgi:hypothetical protein
MKGLSAQRLLVGATAVLLSSSALAVSSYPMGWYLGANAGSTDVSNVSYPGNTSTSGAGVSGNLGYKFMPYFATEFGYSYYANSVIKNNQGTKAGTVKNYSYDIAGKGIWPIMDTGFELFGKLGATRVSASTSINSQAAANSIGLGQTSKSATGVYFGGGASYYMTPEFALNVAWMRAEGNNQTGNLDLLTGGLEFIFG